jgi:LmbE family N-acetylglucosaminyl deacetylase
MDTVTILSPHQDDAGFSLALTIGEFVRAGHRVRIVNCFTESAYAPHTSASSVSEIGAVRSREDREFASRIGNGIEVVDLGLRDAPLRLGCDVSQVRSRKPGEIDREAGAKILESLSGIGSDLVLAPLGVGGHIDHLVVRDVGIQMAKDTHRVIFYEDLPYAAELRACCFERAVRGFARRLGRPIRAAWIRGAAGMGAKLFAIQAYSSQLSGNQFDPIIRYGESHAGCERIWGAEWNTGTFPIAIHKVETRRVSSLAPVAPWLRCASHAAASRVRAILRAPVQAQGRRRGIHVPQAN